MNLGRPKETLPTSREKQNDCELISYLDFAHGLFIVSLVKVWCFIEVLDSSRGKKFSAWVWRVKHEKTGGFRKFRSARISPRYKGFIKVLAPHVDLPGRGFSVGSSHIVSAERSCVLVPETLGLCRNFQGKLIFPNRFIFKSLESFEFAPPST